MADVARDVPGCTRAYIDLLRLVDSISDGDISGLVVLNVGEKTRNQLIQAILNFPGPAVGVLEDNFMNKSYGLIDLLGKHGDLLLVYALLSRGISVRRSQCLGYTLEVRALVRMVRQCERRKVSFDIPPGIRTQLDSFRVPRETSQERTPQSRTTPQSSRKRKESPMEDCKPSSSDRYSTISRIRARAANLEAQKKEQDALRDLESKFKPVKNEPTPRPTLPDHGPPYIMKVGRIPLKASTLSIQTFFEVGADAYKLANKAAHQLDALGRSVDKYRPGRSGLYNKIQAKFPELSAPGSLVINEEQVDGKLYKAARICYDTREMAEKALNEFHEKRFLASDLLSKTVVCTF